MLPGFGPAEGSRLGRGRRRDHRRPAPPRIARRVGHDHAPLPDLLALRDAARLPRGRRLVHRLRRDPPADARRERDRPVDAGLLLEAHGRLAAEHGRLEHLAQALLRAAAAPLPVRLRGAERDRLARGARGAGDRRARRAAGAAPAVGRRGHDLVRRRAAKDVRRIPEVGDAWLDAGIVPFSTLGWNNPEWIEHGYATGAAAGLSGADLPDHAYWEQWFPADWVSEMREQIRLWFYSISFMSMTLVGRVAVPGRAHVREAARRARARDAPLVGECDRGRRGARLDGRRRHALAVLRAEAGPEHQVRVRAGARGQAPAADALELRRFFVDYANVVGSTRASRASSSRSTVGSVAGRAARRGDDRRVRALLDAGCRRLVRVVRRRSVELVHPALAAALLGRRRGGSGDAAHCAPAVARRDRAGDAVPRRASVAGAAAGGWARVGLPGELAGGWRAGRAVARRGRRRHGASSISAARRARAPSFRCGSRCAGSSSRARRWPNGMSTRSAKSCA